MLNQNDYGEAIISWQIPEYRRYERGKTWYLVAGLILLFLVGYAVLTQNFLFALMVILFAVIVFLSHVRAPQMLDLVITNAGVLVNRRFYPYTDLGSYWIISQPPFTNNLYFDFQRSGRQPLSIALDGQNPEEVREALANFLVEDGEKKEEPLADLLWRMLKL